VYCPHSADNAVMELVRLFVVLVNEKKSGSFHNTASLSFAENGGRFKMFTANESIVSNCNP
jgi:hypothetical protein